MTRWNETHFQTEAGAYYKPRKSDRFDNAFQKELIMMKDGTVQNLLSSSVKGRKYRQWKWQLKGLRWTFEAQNLQNFVLLETATEHVSGTSAELIATTHSDQ